MSAKEILVILQKELRDALSNRWLWLFAATFAALALALGQVALSQVGGATGFSRTFAGFINLALLFVPLQGLILGAQSVAGEREQRTLPYLLAQPITRTEFLLGKYLGLGLALELALALGFGVAGLQLAAARIDSGVYAVVVGLAMLLGLITLGIGMLISVFARRTPVALGVALAIWIVLILLADLGLMGTATALQWRADTIFLVALVNPLEVFKMAGILAIRPDLEVLGPAGLYGVTTFGAWLAPLLVGLLVVWAVVPVLAAGIAFSRREEP